MLRMLKMFVIYKPNSTGQNKLRIGSFPYKMVKLGSLTLNFQWAISCFHHNFTEYLPRFNFPNSTDLYEKTYNGNYFVISIILEKKFANNSIAMKLFRGLRIKRKTQKKNTTAETTKTQSVNTNPKKKLFHSCRMCDELQKCT